MGGGGCWMGSFYTKFSVLFFYQTLGFGLKYRTKLNNEEKEKGKGGDKMCLFAYDPNFQKNI